MPPNPLIGVVLHALGGFAAGSFYIPYKRVRGWAWESYWLVGGFFSWIIAPWVVASLAVPDLRALLSAAPAGTLGWCYFFGVLWGIGGLTFGLSMRYLGLSLGYALALGFCAAFGTLIPPAFQSAAGHNALYAMLQSTSGRVVLAGVVVCLAGIAVCGRAGVRKERELSTEAKRATIREFSFVKGVWVAVFAGVMSACMAFGVAAGKPLAELAVTTKYNVPPLWQNTPVFVVILWGGFTTNFIWCVLLNVLNRTAGDYLGRSRAEPRRAEAGDAVSALRESESKGTGASQPQTATRVVTYAAAEVVRPPLLANYLFSAAAGVTWYLQFMFYGMGTTKMGRYDFSSWTIHMAFIIVFSNLWALALREWQASSRRTLRLVLIGILILLASTVVVGYGNFLAAGPKLARAQ